MPEAHDLAGRLRAAAGALRSGRSVEALPDLLDQAAAHLEPPPPTARPALAPAGRLILEADGGSRGNPGPAGAGAVLRDEQGQPLQELKKFLGLATNNVAEYHGLLIGLEAARAHRPNALLVKLDSELLVRQLNGLYQVKSPHVKPLYEQARQLLAEFAVVEIKHVPREQNAAADRLANQAMDAGC